MMADDRQPQSVTAATQEDTYELHRMRAPYLQLGIIILGVFMAVLDMSVVNVAIPSMEAELGATTDQIQWVLTGYMLTIGVLVPISGWMTDRFGPKKLFIYSLIMFTIGSVLCGMSWNLTSIVVFRIVQALGGGFMMPVAMSMTYKIFPPDRRGLVMGIFGIAIMAAPAFGPVLSGYLVQYASWRLIFYINVPIGVIATLLSFGTLQELHHEVQSRLDIWGFLLSTVGFFCLLFGINNVSSHSWHSVLVLGCVGTGIACLILLVIVELQVSNPIIDFRVLKSYMFSMSLVLTSIINTALFVGIFLLPLYLQNVLGYSALRTGLFMTPAALASAVVMPIGGKLFDRWGARPLGLLGLAVITIASFGFTSLTTHSGATQIQWLYVLRSIGMGLTMMPIMTAGMNTLPMRLVNQGTAMTNTARQVASSLGIAVLTTYMTSQAKVHVANLSAMITPFSPQGQQLQHLQQSYIAHGMTPSLAHLMAIMTTYKLVTKQGFVLGMNDTFWVATLLTALAFVCMIFFASKKERAIREGARQKKVSKNERPRAEVSGTPATIE